MAQQRVVVLIGAVAPGDHLSACLIQLPYPEEDFTFRLSAYPWSHAGGFLLATVTDTLDGVDKLALISRDEQGLRFLTETAEDGNWSP